MEPGPVLLSGWLLKKRQEGKIGVLGAKYQKRYFELTAETLAYCKDIKDKNAEVEVFGMHELKSLRRAGDTKIEMHFPERLLVVKAETPGEADRWLQGLDRVYKDTQQVPGTPQAQRRVVESMKRSQIVTALTIEADSDDDDQPPARPAATPTRAAPFRPPLLVPPPEPAYHGSNQQNNSRNDNRPPSPRSLLANPRMGTMMISTPTKREPSYDGADAREAVQSWTPDQESSDDEGSRRRGGAYDTPPRAQAAARRPPPVEEKLVLEPAPAPRNQPHQLRNALSMAHRPREKEEVLELEAPTGTQRTGSGWDSGRSSNASRGGLDRSQSLAVRPGGSGYPSRSNLREETLVLDAPKQAPVAPLQPAAGSRASTASSGSRLSHMARDPAMEERVELQPPVIPSHASSRAGSAHKPPAAPSSGARAGSAGSAYGVGAGSTRAQSAGSSNLGPAPSSAMGGADSDQVDGDWDNWDSESDQDDDSAMNHKRGNAGGKAAAVKGAYKHDVIEEAFDDEQEEVAAAPPPPRGRVMQQQPAPPPQPAAPRPRPPAHHALQPTPAVQQARSSWDEDGEEEQVQQHHHQPEPPRGKVMPRAAVAAPAGKVQQHQQAKAGTGRLEDSDEIQNQQPQAVGDNDWDDWDD
mmetsp:Transcript_26608/g.67793  ORF Transcript_26608/g.67793 Transcript_26608/m.67793 type:complete len:638 (-) Transcript_26608:1174-3087(-)|eukprot:CAMPEP_0202883812 /NCGR_PEP_ID=MMETSP1391-20130828/40003_1 /ASSEMBLY_ACC=CAM_ASM_000867 /TAXON_ID=1034604 /ORGANISM="Chlamydomonas leiostraca, Strain SAG 11-49" /LENGTH=637 /DNA_ID=CAMNT_0049566893 /DNA_START=162 /DNA_END=2075 /DNA_ORIENTATION=+